MSDTSLIHTTAEKRMLLSSIFIVILIGIAYSQMFAVIIPLYYANAFQNTDMILCIIFFITSFRFFVGNQLHLLNPEINTLRGTIWLYDLIVITLQTLLIIFLGSLCVADQNTKVNYDFFTILTYLYIVDIGWIMSQWLFGMIHTEYKRQSIPWPWLILNSGLLVSIWIIRTISIHVYTPMMLTILCIINGVAFIVDVMLIDYHNVL